MKADLRFLTNVVSMEVPFKIQNEPRSPFGHHGYQPNISDWPYTRSCGDMQVNTKPNISLLQT